MATIIHTFEHSYGIRKDCNGDYQVVVDISDDKKYYHATRLSYKNADFALRKAEQFIKKCHSDFTDYKGEQYHFEYKNMGLIQS